MKDKNIYGQLTSVKMNNLQKESTRSIEKRKNSISSIAGVKKDKTNAEDSVVIKPEYI